MVNCINTQSGTDAGILGLFELAFFESKSLLKPLLLEDMLNKRISWWMVIFKSQYHGYSTGSTCLIVDSLLKGAFILSKIDCCKMQVFYVDTLNCFGL